MIEIICRHVTLEILILELAKDLEGCHGLGVEGSCGPPAVLQKLLTMRNFGIALAKRHLDFVETVCMDNGYLPWMLIGTHLASTMAELNR